MNLLQFITLFAVMDGTWCWVWSVPITCCEIDGELLLPSNSQKLRKVCGGDPIGVRGVQDRLSLKSDGQFPLYINNYLLLAENNQNQHSGQLEKGSLKNNGFFLSKFLHKAHLCLKKKPIMLLNRYRR